MLFCYNFHDMKERQGISKFEELKKLPTQAKIGTGLATLGVGAMIAGLPLIVLDQNPTIIVGVLGGGGAAVVLGTIIVAAKTIFKSPKKV